ncbi:Alpha/Beta hydrolase protein [Chaetomium tenue]|uniref:Alpha/Beta hydrolase protein n=1 Tax=Chaetomium tenue TaxID=1854479 RepID=A0ACB7PRZ7_9PEZI|nr:Alpha/Beta hydrolase protein [Chaetomium globosum]
MANVPSANGHFGSTHTIEPISDHTHTAIMLHGRGSNGPEFAEELAETMAPGQEPLTGRFPSWRWVFPSSQELWSTTFEEMLPAWFEAHSLTDTSARADLQMEGIRQSVAYIQPILDEEAASLGGQTEKVVIMGISQGGAIGMWTMLCQEILGKRPGAFVGASTWLPFAANIQMLLRQDDSHEADKGSPNTDPSDAFVVDMLSTWNPAVSPPGADKTARATPIFLGHGVDDAVVDVELGRQAQKVLTNYLPRKMLHAQQPHTKQSSPSQTHRPPMEAFETSKPDRLHQSLSNAWASFLDTQHCTREVHSLKKALDEHVQQTSLSIASLQRDTATRHDLLAASVAEAKSKVEQHAVEIRDIATLRTDFSTFQYEVGQNKDNVAGKVTGLLEKAVAQQESLDGLRSTTSHDFKTIREQYCLALEKVESLQQELKEARAERLASEHKFAALESQVIAITQTQQQLPADSVNLLGELRSYREGLMGLLDKQDLVIPTQNSAPPLNRTDVPLDQGLPAHAPNQDIRSLYVVFRDRYKTNPPKSDTVFIWQFISSIEDPAMSRHIQESLATALPGHVTPSRDMKRKNPLKHVDISKGLTWRKFREALVKIPGPS